ncbi:hypothetical protein BUALT_Bualt17G0095300 [Buddleja alternifolia]|uniref:Uncharacterized protein n=1 Tax=Buddleja alternifolia TaxID=168488 RepID=A0AAV6WF31_9LAMI|nr:hypothetical protein BUALT_Bualt17G0095300 [Buddleja alternifolia]
MAEASAEFLLQNLKQVIEENATLIYNVKNQASSLYDELCLFRGVLKDAMEKPNKSETLKEILKQIRSVVYEAEAAIDTFVIHTAVQKARRRLEKATLLFGYWAKLRGVAKDIRMIRETASSISATRMFGHALREISNAHNRATIEKKIPIVEEHHVVGFKEDAENLIDVLTGGSDEREVVSIVGMPGLGKTTLAKMISRDQKIVREFGNRAFVHISRSYSRKDVFIAILSNLAQAPNAAVDMDEQILSHEIFNHLENVKYLIVLDDVWSQEVWNDLKNVIPQNSNGSRILITTRFTRVAKHANPIRDPYDLPPLTHENSWSLLKLKALGTNDCLPELMESGKHIAEKCGGLPLAIIILGGILLDKDQDEWNKINENVKAHFTMDPEKLMENFIAPSYYDLPYQFKPCFLYFGIFPEGFEIPVWRLVRLWIAEGFIQKEETKSLEDTAEGYLEDLVKRNLVMARSLRLNGKIKTCCVHDMLHEFCRKQASEENFFQDIQQIDHQGNNNYTLEKYRRLCFHPGNLNYIDLKSHGKDLRSFFCPPSDGTEDVASIIGAFKLLKILEARSIRFTQFPTDLIRLIHLRYIVLSIDIDIPKAISKLQNIQTLIVETSNRTLDIKANIWKMYQLRHIKTNTSTTLLGPGGSNTTERRNSSVAVRSGNLQTLSTVSPESCTGNLFSRARNLKKLGIRGRVAKLLENQGGPLFSDNLMKLGNLEHLKLINDVSSDTPLLNRLPLGVAFPPKLKKITLSGTLLDWVQLSELEMLETLEVLKLKADAFKGEKWNINRTGFPALRVLYIDTTDLISWNASSDHFPNLMCLYLRYCTELVAVPSSLASVPSFQKMDLYCTTKAESSARQIQRTKGSGFKLSICCSL